MLLKIQRNRNGRNKAATTEDSISLLCLLFYIEWTFLTKSNKAPRTIKRRRDENCKKPLAGTAIKNRKHGSVDYSILPDRTETSSFLLLPGSAAATTLLWQSWEWLNGWEGNITVLILAALSIQFLYFGAGGTPGHIAGAASLYPVLLRILAYFF